MIIALTGHRPNKLWGYDMTHPKYQTLAKVLRQHALDESADKIISGMALGADTVWACVALNIKEKHNPNLKLECAIPCQGHSSKWLDSSKKTYDRILSLADEITIVTDAPYTPSCMQRRNEYMVDHCDMLIAIWDGVTQGGTWNCIRYARNKDKKIIYINPKEI